MQILKKNIAQIFILGAMIIFGACSDERDKEKDVFGFEGTNKEKNLTIEVVNTQNESLSFTTNENQSIFQSPTLRPTLLFFISKNCEECQGELLHILNLHNKYQEFISVIAISPKDELADLQKQVDMTNPRFKLYAPTDDKNLLNFLSKDEKQSYIALYDKQGQKVIDYVGLVPEEMVELDIRYQIEDQLDAKAQIDMQNPTQETELDEIENTTDSINPTESSTQDNVSNNVPKD